MEISRNRYAQSRDAKEFLIARIVREAQIEGVPLSEVERKMLYFDETVDTMMTKVLRLVLRAK
jgi:hypothetical protein